MFLSLFSTLLPLPHPFSLPLSLKSLGGGGISLGETKNKIKMCSFVKYGKHIRLHFKLTTFISLWTAICGIPKDKATPKPQDPGGSYPRTGLGILTEGKRTGFVIFQACVGDPWLLHHLQAVCPWASCLSSLNLSCYIHKMGR